MRQIDSPVVQLQTILRNGYRFLVIVVSFSLVLLQRGYSQDSSNGIIWYPTIQFADSAHDLYNPRIALSGDDTVHITWSGYPSTVPYARSTNGGASFEPTRELWPDTGASTHYPVYATVVASHGAVHLFFINADPPNSQSLVHMYKSTDGGGTFGTMRNISPNKAGVLDWATISGDTIALLYPPNTPRKILRSTNAGATWSQATESLKEESFIALTPGMLHHVSHEVLDGIVEVEYRRSSDLGNTWQLDTTLSSVDGNYSDIPFVAGYQSECGTEVEVDWRDVKYGVLGTFGASILSRTSLDGGKSWRAESLLTVIPDGAYAVPSISGRVHASAWWKEAVPYDTMHVAVRGSASSLAKVGPETDVSPSSYVGAPPTITTSSHAVHVLWHQYVDGWFRICYRRGEFIQNHAHFSVSEGFVAFDTTVVEYPSHDSLHVLNPGTDTLIVGTAIPNEPNFSVTPSSAAIPPGGSIVFVVSFDPQSAGLKSGKIIFYHNGSSSPDCITVSGYAKWRSQIVGYKPGQWNMISSPLQPGYPQSIPSLYDFFQGYRIESVLTEGVGYWAKPMDSATVYEGRGLSHVELMAKQGWNLIGSLTEALPVGSIVTVPDSLFGSAFIWFDGSGYVSSDTIQPGRSYWVKAKEDGNVILDNSGVLGRSSNRITTRATINGQQPTRERQKRVLRHRQ